MSISSSDYLNQSRKKLVIALGDKKEIYFHQMKQWFRMKVTKEEFDSSARSLLPSESVHLHNEFFLAIITKCQLVMSSSPCPQVPVSMSIKTEPITHTEPLEQNVEMKPIAVSTPSMQNSFTQTTAATLNPVVSERKKMKPKKKTKICTPTVGSNFEPINLQNITPTSNLRDPSAILEASAGYHSRSLQLLDTGHLKGRLLLAAWDHGLTGVNDTVASLLHESSKQCLKNILTSVISKRKGYRLREGKFVHSLGTLPPNPWLRNSVALVDWTSESLGMPLGEGDSCRRPAWPTVDAAEQNAAQLASCAPPYDPPLQPLSAFDLFAALQMDKSVIPSHTVYALNMERISSRLWHPSWADLEQDAIAAKEAAIKETLREQRLK